MTKKKSPEEIAALLGGRLRECRIARQWTITEVSTRLSVAVSAPIGPSQYSNWELGIRRAPLWLSLALAELFEVDYARFVDADSAEWSFMVSRLARPAG